MVFLIAIENNPEDPEPILLEQTVHTLGTWCHPFPSIWLISAPVISAEAIRDELAPFLGPTDQMMVLPLHPDAPISNENWALPEMSSWLTLNS